MLDAYTIGEVVRICPEAPVPILRAQKEEHRPGGAGNVALNLALLGAKVSVLGRIGVDVAGRSLKKTLEKKGIDTSFLLEQEGYITPLKNRFMASSQQLLRVDRERFVTVETSLEEQVEIVLNEKLASFDIIAISDYGKGFLSDRILKALLEKGKQLHIKTIVDPKGLDFEKYRNAFLIKPNQQEAFAAAKASLEEPFEAVATRLLEEKLSSYLLVTRSGAGMSLFTSSGEQRDFPVHVKEVKDVTGAGDTVLSMLSFGLAVGLDLPTSIQWANAAASLAIEKVGCAQIGLIDIRERLLETHSISKVFEAHQAGLLYSLLEGKPYHVFVVEKTEKLSGLFEKIQKAAKRFEYPLMVCIKDGKKESEQVRFLSSMEEVKMILLGKTGFDLIAKAKEPLEIHSHLV